MEDSHDFSNEDIWSPSLREELFSDYNFDPPWDINPDDMFLPRLPVLDSNAADHPPLPPQQRRDIDPDTTNDSSVIEVQNPVTQVRKPSHLDLPNFPLANDPTGASPNSSGRPQPTSINHLPNPATTTLHYNRRFPTPHPPSTLESDASPPDTSSINSDWSDRSVTPWLDTDEDHPGDFVDLTQDSSPPIMPTLRRDTPRGSSGRPGRRNAVDRISPRLLSEALSNPAKRRKTGTAASQSSQRSQAIEGIDLTGVDDDTGLSKVLEQQRVATIKAQQEQASKPVKLSTLQCIICMESMKNLTATSCGHLFCHSCLMEALIAGENQGGEPGKGIPKCPVCRKKVIRPLPTDKRDRHDVVPLAMKLKIASRPAKGKEKAIR